MHRYEVEADRDHVPPRTARRLRMPSALASLSTSTTVCLGTFEHVRCMSTGMPSCCWIVAHSERVLIRAGHKSPRCFSVRYRSLSCPPAPLSSKPKPTISLIFTVYHLEGPDYAPSDIDPRRPQLAQALDALQQVARALVRLGREELERDKRRAAVPLDPVAQLASSSVSQQP